MTQTTDTCDEMASDKSPSDHTTLEQTQASPCGLPTLGQLLTTMSEAKAEAFFRDAELLQELILSGDTSSDSLPTIESMARKRILSKQLTKLLADYGFDDQVKPVLPVHDERYTSRRSTTAQPRK